MMKFLDQHVGDGEEPTPHACINVSSRCSQLLDLDQLHIIPVLIGRQTTTAKAAALTFHQEQVLRLGQPAQTVPLFSIQTSRFLHQTMFPRFEGRLGIGKMRGVGSAYVDDIYGLCA